jgi:DNA-binding transcriptional ArsR family regulator
MWVGQPRAAAKEERKVVMATKRRNRQKHRELNENLRQVFDPMLAKALSHPLRGHILATLGDRIASPNEIAKELGIDARDLNYHIRVLVEIEMIALVYAEQRRGVVEHFYELNSPLVQLDDSGLSQMPEQLRSRLSISILQIAMDEAIDALRAGTFDARESHQSRTTMILDEQGRRDVFELMQGTLERVLEVHRKCSRSLKKRPGEGVPVEVFMMGFETAAGAGRNEGGGATT